MIFFPFLAIDRYRLCVDQNFGPPLFQSIESQHRINKNKAKIRCGEKRPAKISTRIIQMDKFKRFHTKCISFFWFLFSLSMRHQNAEEFDDSNFIYEPFFFVANLYSLGHSHAKWNKNNRKNIYYVENGAQPFICCLFWVVCLHCRRSAAQLRQRQQVSRRRKRPSNTFTFTIIEILNSFHEGITNCVIFKKCLARGVCYLWGKCSLMLCWICTLFIAHSLKLKHQISF